MVFYDCQLNKLQRVQNAYARLIFRQQKFCHVTPFIYELHWLPIKYRIEFEILLITLRILNFLAPTYLSSLISLRLPSKYNLRNSSDALPFDIRSASTVSIFIAKLKTHLFRHALLSQLFLLLLLLIVILAFQRFYFVF